jgi:hypothetical protein
LSEGRRLLRLAAGAEATGSRLKIGPPASANTCPSGSARKECFPPILLKKPPNWPIAKKKGSVDAEAMFEIIWARKGRFGSITIVEAAETLRLGLSSDVA